MYREDLRYYLHQLVNNTVFQQLAPVFIFFLIPALILTARAHKSTLLHPFFMVLEALSLAFPWNWYNGHSPAGSSSDKRKPRKKLVRTRAGQLLNGDAASAGSSKESYEDDGYYPGIVNISGTYCFMDSTLQAMASLSYLQPYVDEIHARAEELDVPSPVVDALRDILHTLNKPKSSPRALRPLQIIEALANHSKGKHSALFSSREHQDAQELFQLLSEAIKSEATAVLKEGLRDRGLGGLGRHSEQAYKELSKGVFDGLTANRRSCMQCGYTEAVMHFAFDNWQLAVPRQPGGCQLEDCLADYTKLEFLTDCICRKCSMVATYERLSQEADKLTEAIGADPDVSSSKRKRAREARRLAARVKAALDEGRIEEDIKGVKMEKVFSTTSTKQAMIARPPPVLALHLNRSVHYGHYAAKNTCQVLFPEILDLTRFTTSGKLSTVPLSPISAPPPPLPFNRSTTPTPATYATPRTIYRLSSVVCHYGQHSFGHYICYRRKPRPPSSGPRRYFPAKLACPLGCECEDCENYGPVRDDDYSAPSGSGRDWLRISDDSVRECGIESVMQEGSGVFMLYYEKVVQEGVYGASSPRCSEETLKPVPPEQRTVANGSCTSLLDGIKDEDEKMGLSVSLSSSPPRMFEPRIVRNVNAQRAKSPFVPPPTNAHASSSTSSQTHTRGFNPLEDLKPITNGGAHLPTPPSSPLLLHQQTTKYPLESKPMILTPESTTPASTQDAVQVDLSSSELPVRRSSLSRPRSRSRSLSPPQQARLQQPSPASSVRMKAPQPIYAASAEPISPPRTVGLRA